MDGSSGSLSEETLDLNPTRGRGVRAAISGGLQRDGARPGRIYVPAALLERADGPHWGLVLLGSLHGEGGRSQPRRGACAAPPPTPGRGSLPGLTHTGGSWRQTRGSLLLSYLGSAQREWGCFARQGEVLGRTNEVCAPEEASWESRSGSTSFLTGLFSLGDSPFLELAFSSATKTSKSFARPCTSRRWCTE